MKRKGILQFMKNCLENPCYNNEIYKKPSVVELMKILLSDIHKHYEFLDIEKYGCHERRFFLLYMNKNDLSFEDMERETHIGESGFKKWVRFYNNTALETVIRKSKANSDYAFLLNEYLKSKM